MIDNYDRMLFTMKDTLFSEALRVVQATELRTMSILPDGNNTQTGDPRWKYKKLLFHPLKFVWAGASERFLPLIVWVALCALLWIVASQISLGLNTPEGVTIALGAAVVLIPAIIALCALPSIYTHSRITPSAVTFVSDHLRSREFRSTKETESLLKLVKSFEDRARSRVTACKWALGITWAAFLYFFTRMIDAAMSGNLQQVSSYGAPVLLLLIASVGAFAFVTAYESAIDQVFKSIEHGVLEFNVALEEQKQTSNASDMHPLMAAIQTNVKHALRKDK
jgi:hypothetical protein